MANGNRRQLAQGNKNVGNSTERDYIPSDSAQETKSAENGRREKAEDQKPHSIRILTTTRKSFEHRNVRHGFDGDDLIVISAVHPVSWMYPKQNILQLTVIDEDDLEEDDFDGEE